MNYITRMPLLNVTESWMLLVKANKYEIIILVAEYFSMGIGKECQFLLGSYFGGDDALDVMFVGDLREEDFLE